MWSSAAELGCVLLCGVAVARGKSCVGVYKGDHRGSLSNQLLRFLERKNPTMTVDPSYIVLTAFIE